MELVPKHSHKKLYGQIGFCLTNQPHHPLKNTSGLALLLTPIHIGPVQHNVYTGSWQCGHMTNTPPHRYQPGPTPWFISLRSRRLTTATSTHTLFQFKLSPFIWALGHLLCSSGLYASLRQCQISANHQVFRCTFQRFHLKYYK